MDLDNLTKFLASYCPSRVVAARDDGDMLVDRYHLDALTGRFEAERTVIRGGRTRRVNFVKRLFGFPELRDWLLAAGFTEVAGYGEDGRPLTADHKRMIIVAGLPADQPATGRETPAAWRRRALGSGAAGVRDVDPGGQQLPLPGGAAGLLVEVRCGADEQGAAV